MEHGSQSGGVPELPDATGDRQPPEPRQAPSATGELRVDAALRRLGELEGTPVSEHPQVFEAVHGQLVDVLGELHASPDPTQQAGLQGEASRDGPGAG